MVSRLDESSISVASADSPLKMFTTPPTQEDTIDSEWAEVLATQDVTASTHGDVIEFRVPGVGKGEGWNPSESFVKVEGYWQKGAQCNMREEGLPTEQITTALGFPEVGLFSRCSLALNNTVVNQECTEYDTAEFVNALMTRPARELAAGDACWAFDELYDGPGASMGFTLDATLATSGTVANVAAGSSVVGTLGGQGVDYVQFGVTNKQLRDALILPSSNAANDSGDDTAKLPAVLGDLRAGMRCRIFAIGSSDGGGSAGAGATALSNFNQKYVNQTFIIQRGTSTTIPSGPYLRPASDSDTGICHFLLQNASVPIIPSVNGTPAQTNINTYLPSADIFATPATASTLQITKFRIVIEPDSMTMLDMMRRRATLLPLGMNRGALERRQRYLAGGAFGADGPEKYQKFSVAYQPFVGPGWKDCGYIPPGLGLVLRLTLNDKSHMIRDYSDGGVAGANLTMKLTSARLFQRRQRYSPQVDLALGAQYDAGSVLKLTGKYFRQFAIRSDAGASSFVVRSFLQGQKAEKYIVWVSPDDLQGPSLPQNKSNLDINWEPGIDITEIYLVIGGKIYPARRLTIDSQAQVVDASNTRHLTPSGVSGLTPGILPAPTVALNSIPTHTQSSGDTAASYWNYRSAVSDPSDPAVPLKRWSSYPLWVFDTSLTHDNGVVDPVQEGVSVELRITTSRQTTVPMKIGIQAINDAVIDVTGQGVVTSSMDS